MWEPYLLDPELEQDLLLVVRPTKARGDSPFSLTSVPKLIQSLPKFERWGENYLYISRKWRVKKKCGEKKQSGEKTICTFQESSFSSEASKRVNMS